MLCYNYGIIFILDKYIGTDSFHLMIAETQNQLWTQSNKWKWSKKLIDNY